MTYATIHFVRYITLSILLTVSFLLLAIPRAEAYFTTNQEAVAFDDGSAIFLIEYAFGVKNRDVHMPVFAQYSNNKASTAVSYAVFDESGAEVEGTAAGIVLSSATLDRSGMYIVPKGTAKKFTLAVVFTPRIPAQTEKKYRLQVMHLPFSFDGIQQLQLNPSELKYYTTKLIAL
jgi:hypothetical protein